MKRRKRLKDKVEEEPEAEMNPSLDAAADFESLEDVPWWEACYVVALNRLVRGTKRGLWHTVETPPGVSVRFSGSSIHVP